MRFIKIYLVVIFLLVLNTTCKKEKEDPCKGQSKVSADFKIEEIVFGSDLGPSTATIQRYFESDTIIATHKVRFTATQDLDEYFWVVGTDTTKKFKTKSFILEFNDPTQLHVILIGKRNVKKECFPNDDGIDTVKKQLVVLPHPATNFPVPISIKYPLFGSYEGYHEDEPDRIFTIIIKLDSNYQGSGFSPHIALHNLPEGCEYNNLPIYMGYKNMHIGAADRAGSECARGVRGWARLQENRRDIIIEYDRCVTDKGSCAMDNIKKRIFRGKRK